MKTSKELTIIEKKSQTLKIKGPPDMQKATELLSKINKFSDKITEEKEKLTKPLNQALKEIRARYKPQEDLLENAIRIIREQMSAYQSAQIEIQKLAEKKLLARVESGSLSIEKASEKMSAISSPEGTTKTASGSVSFRAIKKFEVVNISLLPIDYHLPDVVKIRAEMSAGRELPGVKYFEEQVAFNKR